ncbi:hypothetical protein EV1_043269 [Malus domestica]
MILMMILPYTVYVLAGQELWCCLLCSCRPGAVGVAFYARADQERCAMQFRLVQARSLCVLQFRLLQTRSFGVAFYARANQERWCCLLCSCRPGALCHAV